MSKPTKSQESKWLEMISNYAKEYGAFPHNDPYGFDLHHVRGRTFKHKKVHVGSWFVIPVTKKYHDVMSNNEFNVTHYPKRYAIEFNSQVSQFVAMCAVMSSEGLELPFGSDVMHVIQDLNV